GNYAVDGTNRQLLTADSDNGNVLTSKVETGLRTGVQEVRICWREPVFGDQPADLFGHTENHASVCMDTTECRDGFADLADQCCRCGQVLGVCGQPRQH